MAQAENAVVEELRAIELQLGVVNELVSDANNRIGALGMRLSSMVAQAERIDARLNRIEHRLDAIAEVF
jgi:DNA repair ATPase RecN